MPLVFFVNSTIGLFGLVDVATAMVLEKHEEDFGQTLAVWNIKPGPYIVLPFLGPSNARDLLSRLFQVFYLELFLWMKRMSKYLF